MSFVGPLLDWYEKNARELPWRSFPTPYRTWVSEIMLQQTQVDTVIPYFNNWMERFPNVEMLAAADEREVLSLWEGLGYYSRARNLHRAAKIITSELEGKLPETDTALAKLPGIGPYTSAAIASIAFQADVAAVDGNIRRVLSRLFNVSEPARSVEGEKILWALAKTYLPQGKASSYNQAMMDLGATICLPKNPECDHCPIANTCLARKLGVQQERPVKRPRKKVPHLTVTAAVILREDTVLLAQRPSPGLLGGLWEFPGGTMEETDVDLRACLQREITEELGVTAMVGASFGQYQHAYTHFKITLTAFLCEIPITEQPQPLASNGLVWARLDELSAYPMGKVDRQIARKLTKEVCGGTLPS